MKVLVVGSGGREHALVWKIAQSNKVKKIYCAPGNAGIEKLARCVDIAATDIDALLQFALTKRIDLTVVGPESSLVAGIVDLFEAHGLRIFGPSKEAANLEGSKVFAKNFLKKYQIPSAEFETFNNKKKAKKFIEAKGAPLVVKADGLAAGKGVFVARTVEEAKQAVDDIMSNKVFGKAGDSVVIEACLAGEEVSFIVFTDGKTVLPLPSSQDHKAIFDNDEGPNTGGMGAYSPAPVVSDSIADYVVNQVMQAAVEGMRQEGIVYKGFLYAGLMIEKDQVRVLEFNCRLGDPEAQPLLMRLKTDIIEIFDSVIDQRLEEIQVEVDPRPTACVVMAAGGYPGHFAKGRRICGLSRVSKIAGLEVFHAGTVRESGRLVTSGGRVLGITAIGDDLRAALGLCYRAVEAIRWPDCYYRRDIGAKALAKLDKGDNTQIQVGIVMGSDSDLSVMKAAADIVRDMGVSCEMTVASAHRSPERAAAYAHSAKSRGVKVIIAGAGMAAHLAGVLAAHTDLPVIGVPLNASSLNGIDALLSTVQMPPGVPVATMGIGRAGAKNAGIMALKILALSDHDLAEKLVAYRERMVAAVEEKAKRVERQ
ncbi:MAG: 5-(carboxyamino)imidazole ribonucleotide mutase [Deltaproteobacteria bacterium]|nr:MAG: 5-(carboxyamino)imidazole ribonucleotide mutase [Deltaproteobacteria bacterium]